MKNISKLCPNKETLVLLLTAFVVITLFSRSSFLYPTNDWEDANAYFTVGKSMLYGYVPYRDLFDHKGPALFIIHALGALISFKSFFGVYLIEILFCFAYLKVSKKIIDLFLTSDKTLYFVTLSAIIVYSSFCFAYGDSVEEFSLPLLTYSLYLLIRYAHNDEIPSKKQCVLLGICAGVIFWMKFNICGFYAGAFIAICYLAIRDKRTKDFLNRLCFVIIGLFVVTVPIWLYFMANNSVKYLVDVYFVMNIFHYNATDASIEIIPNTIEFFKWNILLGLLLLCCVFSFRKFSKYEKIVVAASFLALFFSVFFVHAYNYYSFTFPAFVPIALLPLIRYSDKIQIRKLKRILLFCTVLITCCAFNHNIWALFSGEVEIRASVAKDINESGSILNYNTGDLGIYTLLGVIPSERFFYRPSLSLKTSIIANSQNRCLAKKRVDYVVSQEPISNKFGYHLQKTYVSHYGLGYLLENMQRFVFGKVFVSRCYATECVYLYHK